MALFHFDRLAVNAGIAGGVSAASQGRVFDGDTGAYWQGQGTPTPSPTFNVPGQDGAGSRGTPSASVDFSWHADAQIPKAILLGLIVLVFIAVNSEG